MDLLQSFSSLSEAQKQKLLELMTRMSSRNNSSSSSSNCLTNNVINETIEGFESSCAPETGQGNKSPMKQITLDRWLKKTDSPMDSVNKKIDETQSSSLNSEFDSELESLSTSKTSLQTSTPKALNSEHLVVPNSEVRALSKGKSSMTFDAGENNNSIERKKRLMIVLKRENFGDYLANSNPTCPEASGTLKTNFPSINISDIALQKQNIQSSENESQFSTNPSNSDAGEAEILDTHRIPVSTDSADSDVDDKARLRPLIEKMNTTTNENFVIKSVSNNKNSKKQIKTSPTVTVGKLSHLISFPEETIESIEQTESGQSSEINNLSNQSKTSPSKPEKHIRKNNKFIGQSSNDLSEKNSYAIVETEFQTESVMKNNETNSKAIRKNQSLNDISKSGIITKNKKTTKNTRAPDKQLPIPTMKIRMEKGVPCVQAPTKLVKSEETTSLKGKEKCFKQLTTVKSPVETNHRDNIIETIEYVVSSLNEAQTPVKKSSKQKHSGTVKGGTKNIISTISSPILNEEQQVDECSTKNAITEKNKGKEKLQKTMTPVRKSQTKEDKISPSSGSKLYKVVKSPKTKTIVKTPDCEIHKGKSPRSPGCQASSSSFKGLSQTKIEENSAMQEVEVSSTTPGIPPEKKLTPMGEVKAALLNCSNDDDKSALTPRLGYKRRGMKRKNNLSNKGVTGKELFVEVNSSKSPLEEDKAFCLVSPRPETENKVSPPKRDCSHSNKTKKSNRTQSVSGSGSLNESKGPSKNVSLKEESRHDFIKTSSNDSNFMKSSETVEDGPKKKRRRSNSLKNFQEGQNFQLKKKEHVHKSAKHELQHVSSSIIAEKLEMGKDNTSNSVSVLCPLTKMRTRGGSNSLKISVEEQIPQPKSKANEDKAAQEELQHANPSIIAEKLEIGKDKVSSNSMSVLCPVTIMRTRSSSKKENTVEPAFETTNSENPTANPTNLSLGLVIKSKSIDNSQPLQEFESLQTKPAKPLKKVMKKKKRSSKSSKSDDSSGISTPLSKYEFPKIKTSIKNYESSSSSSNDGVNNLLASQSMNVDEENSIENPQIEAGFFTCNDLKVSVSKKRRPKCNKKKFSSQETANPYNIDKDSSENNNLDIIDSPSELFNPTNLPEETSNQTVNVESINSQTKNNAENDVVFKHPLPSISTDAITNSQSNYGAFIKMKELCLSLGIDINDLFKSPKMKEKIESLPSGGLLFVQGHKTRSKKLGFNAYFQNSKEDLVETITKLKQNKP